MNIWQKVKPDGKLPGDRAAHSCDQIGDNLYVFGGWNGINALCDIYTYSFQNNIWKEVQANGDQPSFRNNHTTAVYQTRLYVHGGHNGNLWLDDLFYLETTQSTWVKVQVNGNLPTARACHSLNRISKKLYLFGGYDGQECFNEIEIFDLTNNTWYQPNVKGFIPTARNAHTMTTHNNKLILFGGHSGAQHLHDIHIFDSNTVEWSQVETSGVLPKGLRGHTANLIEDNIYVFGGYDGSGRSNDLFILNLQSWHWIIPTMNSQLQIPQPRQRHSACSTENDKIYIFGGFDGNKWLNDLFVLDICQLEMSSMQQFNTNKMIENMKNNLLNNKDNSDVIFEFKNQKCIYGHKIILQTQSEHFRALFNSNMKDSNQSIFQIQDYSYESFLILMDFIYTGNIQLPSQFQILIELLGLSDKYGVDGLKQLIEKQLKKQINNQHVCDLLIYATKYQALTLKQACMQYLLKNISQISGTQQYEKLQVQPSILIEVTRALLTDSTFIQS